MPAFKTGLKEVPFNNQPQTLSISKKIVKYNLRVFYVPDGDFIVSIMPALSLTGYGKTLSESKAMLKAALDDYLDKLRHLDYPATELSKYGWKLEKFSKKHFENSAFVDKEGVLRNLKLPNDTPIQEAVLKVA